jgi:uncharacterized Zn-finger protein
MSTPSHQKAPEPIEDEKDHLVICPHCEMEMEPHVMLQYGVPSSSVCSLCNKTYKFYGLLGVMIDIYQGIRRKFFTKK